MEKNDLVSVIVPVYNTDKFLSECLCSILAQTYKNIEIIAVDNGSADRSGEICDSFAKKHSNIKVIHQENRGAGGARNTGINSASGKFISFVDSDDVIDKEMIEMLLDCIQDHSLSCCGYGTMDEEGNILDEKPVSDKTRHMTAGYFLRVLFGMSRMVYQGYVWNKLYRSEIINKYHIRFDEGLRYNEDRLFLTEYLLHAKSCVCFANKLYYYRIRTGSVMGELKKGFDEANLTELFAYEKMEKLLKEHPFIRMGMRIPEQQSAQFLLQSAKGNERAEEYIKDFMQKRGSFFARPIMYASKLIDSILG